MRLAAAGGCSGTASTIPIAAAHSHPDTAAGAELPYPSYSQPERLGPMTPVRTIIIAGVVENASEIPTGKNQPEPRRTVVVTGHAVAALGHAEDKAAVFRRRDGAAQRRRCEQRRLKGTRPESGMNALDCGPQLLADGSRARIET